MPYPKTHEKVIELVPKIDKDIDIVDLGCGKGEVVRKLKELEFKNISYCDLKDNFDGNVKICDLNNTIPYKSSSFDLVVSTEVIEHLENKFLFFSEVKRVLKRNGVFIFSTPNLSNIPNRILYLITGRFIEFNIKEFPEHKNPFFNWELPRFFKIEKITYNRGFIPLVRLPFITNKFFGQTVIVKCRLK